MADMLEEAVDMLAGELTANLSHTVTYKRGSQSVELQATVGRGRGELGDKVWRWGDPYHKIMRIHTKEIRQE
jgi:hypothetical protein